MKVCKTCGIKKPLTSFRDRNDTKDKKSYYCRECESLYAHNHYVNHIDKRTEQNKQWRIDHPKMAWINNTLSYHKKDYKIMITSQELNKFIEQTTTCKICGCELDFSYYGKKTTQDNSPTLDRTNNEDYIDVNNIQILCHQCNATKRNRTMKEFIDYCKMVSKIEV